LALPLICCLRTELAASVLDEPVNLALFGLAAQRFPIS
jgi:hypothetical protein